MTHYDRYLIELDNYRIYIRLKNASLGVQEIGPVIKNISLDLQEVDRDIASPLVKTLLSLTFIDAPELGQGKCGNWEEFYTPDSTKWMIDIVDRTGNLVWSGFVTPDSYMEELRYRGNVTIIARDGVGRLQDFDFEASGNEQGMISLRELVETGWALTESKMTLTWGESKSDAWMVCDGSMAYDTYMNVSAFEGMSWYDAIEAALASYGACMRYIGDGRMAVVSLRYLPKLRNLTRSASVAYAFPTFLSFGTRELQPSLKEIREKFTYDLDKAKVPLSESISFTGESSNALALIGGLSKEVETTVHNISSSVWGTVSANTSLFFDKSTMVLADTTPQRLGISDNAILIAGCVQQTNRLIWCDIPMVPDSINLVIEWGNKIAKNGRDLSVLDNDSEIHMYYYLTASSNKTDQYYNGKEWVSNKPSSLQITSTNGKMSIPVPKPPFGDRYTLRLTIQYPSIQTTTKDTVYSGIYLSINDLFIENGETKSLVATNSVKTIYNGANNIIIDREPKLGPTFNSVGLPGLIKNGIFQYNNGFYLPTPEWTWNAGGSYQQMAVYNHLCIISYYAKPNNILQGTILYDSKTLIDPALIWSWGGTKHLLRSGSFDLLNNRINNAVLLEYDDYDYLWGVASTALPETQASSSATNGTSNKGGSSGESGGNSGSGGSESTITVDTVMSDSSTNPVQNKVVKSYVDNKTTVDTVMSDSSTNPVQNKVVKSYVDNKTTVDTVMSDSSTNPVQNKVVKSYVDNNKTTVDIVMSDSSTNPVQNKVVKSYVDDKTTVDTLMSDSSTNPVQNKVVKSYVDDSIKVVKQTNVLSVIRSAGPEVTMLDNYQGVYIIRFNHPWLLDEKLAAEVVLMHYNRKSKKKVNKYTHRKSKAWRMAHGRDLTFVINRNIMVEELKDYIVKGWLVLDDIEDAHIKRLSYEQIKRTRFEKYGFRNTRLKKSKTFGWAVRYPNPLFNDVVDAGEIKDSTTMIAGVPRWIYSDVSPMDIYVHYVNNIVEEDTLAIGLRLM